MEIFFDSETEVSQILQNQVTITLGQAIKLGQFFNVSPSLFLANN